MVQLLQTVAKINKTKSWFFEKLNKINKPWGRLMKKKGVKLKSIRLEMKKKLQHTMQKYKETQDYYEQL